MSNDSNAAFSDLSDSLKTGPIANSKWLIIWSEKERERFRFIYFPKALVVPSLENLNGIFGSFRLDVLMLVAQVAFDRIGGAEPDQIEFTFIQFIHCIERLLRRFFWISSRLEL